MHACVQITEVSRILFFAWLDSKDCFCSSWLLVLCGVEMADPQTVNFRGGHIVPELTGCEFEKSCCFLKLCKGRCIRCKGRCNTHRQCRDADNHSDCECDFCMADFWLNSASPTAHQWPDEYILQIPQEEKGKTKPN